MNTSLIPVARRVYDNRFVDVYSVPRGLECHCVCPSCGVVLVAKQGSQKEWHFAHKTKGDRRGVDVPCNYSFFVSARAMLRQISQPSLQLLTPNYSIDIPGESGFQRTVDVAGSKLVTLTTSRIDDKIGGVTVDICGEVAGHLLAVFIEHEGRQSPARLCMENESGYGVVALSLELLPMFIAEHIRSDFSYTECLRKYISTDASPRRWLYQPRQKSVIGNSRAPASSTRQIKNDHGTRHHAIDGEGRYVYNCLLCSHIWRTDDETLRTCTKCGQSGSLSKQSRK